MFDLIDKVRRSIVLARFERGKTATKLDYYLNRKLPLPTRKDERVLLQKKNLLQMQWSKKKRPSYTLRPMIMRVDIIDFRITKGLPKEAWVIGNSTPKRVKRQGSAPTYKNPYPSAVPAEQLFL